VESTTSVPPGDETATLEPISAGFIAYFFLGEALEPLQILGAALVIGAIILLQLRSERTR